MDGGYTVERIDTQAFDTAISEMNKAIRIFSTARQKIIAITDPVTDTWEGRGADAFQKVYKKLKTELEDEETNLTMVRDDIIGIKDSYEGWDMEIKNQLQNNGGA